MLKSNFSLNLSYNLDNTAKEYLFKPIISKFLYCQTGTTEDFEILQAETYISSYDFKNSQITSMEYVYLNFINEISHAKGILDIPINIFIPNTLIINFISTPSDINSGNISSEVDKYIDISVPRVMILVA